MPATQPITTHRSRLFQHAAPSTYISPYAGVSAAHPALPRPAEALSEAPPVILSARPLLATCPTLAIQLREARCELVLAATWERLVVSCEKTLADVILVDYDAVERAYHAGRQRISGHRLIALLARSLAPQEVERPRALVALSQMDYAELEDLVHLGIHALERPDQPERLVGRILATYRRVALNRLSQINLINQTPRDGAQLPSLVTDAAWTVITTALAMAGVATQRARVSDRLVFEGLCFLMQTGAHWRLYPAGCGSVTLARRRLALWRAAGVFTRLGWAAQAGARAVQPIIALPWDRLTAPAYTGEEAAGAHSVRAVSQSSWATRDITQ